MRLHVLSLPHTQVTRAYSVCAYTEKVRKFCTAMTARGHEIILYAGEENEAEVAAHVVCISEAERRAAVGGRHYVEAAFDSGLPHWRTFNGNAIREIGRRAGPRDIVCISAGHAQQPVADAFPQHLSVEFGVGYGGTFARFRVFESYAWMHMHYGAANPQRPEAADGAFYDAVIPNLFEVEDFPFRAEKEDYALFVGRMIERKGVSIAVDACRAAGLRLVTAGPGTPPPGVEHVGIVGPEERGRLMAGARALLAPTLYVEPFGGVVVEAMLCGTPAITTDWGAFTETVEDGVTGYRCRTLQEFVDALGDASSLDAAEIRRRAVARYSAETVARLYERYFERLSGLWGAGWPSLRAA